MNRQEFENYISQTYGVCAEYPWENYPTYAVYRHKSDKKWFAIVMTIDKTQLGFLDGGEIDVVNLKCGESIAPSLWPEKGIFPAYHMNKEHWISVELGGCVSDKTLKFLLALSFDLTKTRHGKKD